jgi:predicted ATP-grasp superfamily ATP-dependent carboligase
MVYERNHEFADLLIAQEYIPGTSENLYSCNCYYDGNSKPVATFIARKLRQWPPETGESCLGEEIRNDEVLQETLNLFDSVGYRGLGYVEIKKDSSNGKYYIMEPNIGRPTGRSAIAEAGGVDLLYTMYCDALGRPLPDNRFQKYGNVKWIHFRRDLQSAVYYWRRGELTFGDWWRSVRGRKVDALFAWNDLGPFLGDLTRAIRLFLSPEERKKRDYSDVLS